MSIVPPIPQQHAPTPDNQLTPSSTDTLRSINFDKYSQTVKNNIETQIQKLKNNVKRVSDLDVQESPSISDMLSGFLKSLEEKFRDRSFYQILPQAYFEQQVEIISCNIEASLKEFKEHLSPKSEDNTDKTVAKGKHKLPKEARQVLKSWFIEHIEDPYPSAEEKERLAKDAGINLKQVNTWFINKRGNSIRRLSQPEKFTQEIRKKLVTEQQKRNLEKM